MKRSRNVALVLMGTAAVALAGCDERPPEDAIFHSLADCRQYYDEDICRTKAGEAEQMHLASAPKYQSKETCEASFGADACVETPAQPAQGQEQASASSWFMPAMMGFMLGRAMSPMPLYYGAPNAAGTQAGGTPARQSVYSGNRQVGATEAASRQRWNAAAPATAASRTSALASPTRGGFGATGRGYSGSAAS
jgi:uncharacterized protein YgiB involved in biofilm formation